MMIIIRNEQLDILTEGTENEFHNRAHVHVMKYWPRQAQKMGESLTDFIQTAISKARSYNIQTEVQIIRYLNMSIVWGDAFDSLEWAQEILSKKNVSALAKIHELSQITKAKLKA